VSRTNFFPETHHNNSRVFEVFDWVIAIYSFKLGDDTPLREMLDGDQPAPCELQSALHDIENGRTKPNKKSAVKQKMSPKERLLLAADVSNVLGGLDLMLSKKAVHVYEDQKARFIEFLADDERSEVIDIVKNIKATKERVKFNAAKKHAISKRTLEGYLRELRSIIECYPEI
jgi:hypothetical protein